MTIVIDRAKRVLVQGITGREGMARTRLMVDYGTQVVAGVTPGKGGQSVMGIPVFDTVMQAIQQIGNIDISVLFVPAPLVKTAAIEALYAGVKLLVIVPDRVPLYDVLEISAVAKAQRAKFIGPNTLGVLSPDVAVLGMMGGRADALNEWAFAGNVGITSRSGGVTTSMAYYITQAGFGLSTLVHVGGDSVVGMSHADVLRQFEADPQTQVVVMFGEIGTSQEEDAADLIEAGGFTKPLIVYIGGKAASEGMRFSHAGAIIEGNTGTYQGKVSRLREVGAIIAESYTGIPVLVADVLGKSPTVTATEPTRSHGWKTAITDIQPDVIRVRGHPIDRLMGKTNFGQVVYLTLMGTLPASNVGRMIEAILVSSVDHGATPPSTLAARTSTSTGAPINAALAVGLLSINTHHGGAIEACMQVINAIVQLQSDTSISQRNATEQVIKQYRDSGEEFPIGHRVHTNDPRARRLIALAYEEGISSSGVEIVQHIVNVLQSQTGRALPLNVDGAIAGVLYDLAVPHVLGNTFFMMSRTPGLIAHIIEERTHERPMRRIDPNAHYYNEDTD